MSQPPQPPDPHGQQPDPHGQQPGYPSQPGYPPQSGYGQQPGYGQTPGAGFPQSGGYPQGAPSQHPGGFDQPGQYGQQPQYGQYQQQGPYGQPGPYGPNAQPVGGYPLASQPPKSKLPWILAGGGVLVIAAVVTLILVLTGGTDTSSPEGVAEAAVSAANDRDVDALLAISCKKLKADEQEVRNSIDPGAGSGIPGMENIKVKFTLGKVETTSDTEATAEVSFNFENLPEQAKDLLGDSTKGNLELLKEDGKWTVCGFN